MTLRDFGSKEHAARLLGAYRHLSAGPVDRFCGKVANYPEELHRAFLDCSENFYAEWTAGGFLSYEEAVAYALEPVQ